ncbi:MAG: TetR/AcrR family transcriptional regulator [Sneathiella sp.]
MQQNSERRSNMSRTKATRASLIQAARTLFIEKGYAETGTPEIVKTAKVTRGALYHHFNDKADLFRAVVHQEAEAVSRQIEKNSVDPKSALDALVRGMDAYFEAMAKPERIRILLLDGPAVLGPDEMQQIDKHAGGEELRQGLAYALDQHPAQPLPLEALSILISAAFDRAALAIAKGQPEEDYKTAMTLILSSLIKSSKGET